VRQPLYSTNRWRFLAKFAHWKEDISGIHGRLTRKSKHSTRSNQGPVASSNGAEALPSPPTRRGRTPFWKPGTGKRLIFVSAGILCVGIIARIGYYLLGEATPTTEKAIVEGYTYPVSSRIVGRIAGIFVSNRQYVKAGDLLAEIDRRHLEAILAAARTELAQAKTTLPEIETQLSRAQAELDAAESRMFHRNRQLTEATSDYQYFSKIRTKNGISPLLFSRAEKEYESALSEYSRAKTMLASAGDRVREVQALKDANVSKMQTAETTVRQMESDLSLTKIYAPANGHVVFDKPDFAHRFSAGEPFLKLVGDDPWAVASFTENQSKHIKLGQRVTIRIKAIKNHTFHGEVVHIAPVARGSGGLRALFLSLLAFFDPPQTVEVKIAFDSESVLGVAEQIEPGLNTSVEVDPR
jgi:membrane fusion protein, multidrug efflux system